MASKRQRHDNRPRRSPATAPPPRRATALTPVLLLAALVAVVYANSLPNQFVFDDHVVVEFNSAVDPGAEQALEHRHIGYRPIRTLSYALDNYLWGDQPFGYRVSNLVYHVLAGCLALTIYRQLGLSAATALLAAAVFVTHPIQTESVAYISGRRDVLCGVFVLLGFSLFLRWRQSDGRWWQLAVALAALAAGLLTKEVAFAFPLLVVAYDATLGLARHRAIVPSDGLLRAAVAVVRQNVTAYAALLSVGAAGLGYLVIRGIPTYQPWWGGSVLTNLLNVAQLWVHSAVQLLLPIHLLADYSRAAVPVVTTAAAPVAWAALVALLALFTLSCCLLTRAPRAVFLLWWIALTLLPSSHVIPHHDFWAEHYFYLPLFGFSGCLALVLTRSAQQLGLTRRQLVVGSVLLVTVYGVRTAVRNRDWASDLALWRATATLAPNSVRARANYGGALLAQGDVAGAEAEFQAALALDPNQRSSWSGMIMVHHANGNLAQRDQLLRQFMISDSPSYTNLLSVAAWFLINKEYPLAIKVAEVAKQRAVTIGRPGARALTVEAWARARSGQLDQGCPMFDEALRRRPDLNDALAGRQFCRQQRSQVR